MNLTRAESVFLSVFSGGMFIMVLVLSEAPHDNAAGGIGTVVFLFISAYFAAKGFSK